jgi:hypothetical protein
MQNILAETKTKKTVRPNNTMDGRHLKIEATNSFANFTSLHTHTVKEKLTLFM